MKNKMANSNNNRIITEAINNYNRYRKPEAVAELISFKDNKSIIKFSGHFRHTCCVNDYFDDFVVECNNKVKIKEIKEKKEFYLVEFSPIDK
ncbi:MAG: hypothetical protein QF655_00295 [Candidatus Woesearchaeota archaeon]|jgi:hypothetical protein|nr:hypothetical protein [Candidatus Woesearchaeota archaeon]MDP7476061.1 hypothetical protein [Candidatus Woesearchaeota archaeon]